MDLEMDKSYRLVKVLTLVILMAVFLTGCVGIRPAVKPPPPVADVQQEETETQQTEEETVATEPEADTEETPSIEEIETEEEEAQLNDDLDLPSSAMPAGVLPPAPVPMIPNAGPAPKGKEPVTLVDGWKVKILQAPSMDSIQQVQQDLKKVTGEKTHVHWQNGSFVLLLGNFAEKAKAESLKEKMVLNGYEQSAVVKSPIVSDVPAPEVEPVETGTIADKETEILYGWRIQVMSLADMPGARAELSRVENMTGLKAYIEEVSGSFKIRVGNFKDRAAALEAKKQVTEAGFEGAFPVETRIENE